MKVNNIFHSKIIILFSMLPKSFRESRSPQKNISLVYTTNSPSLLYRLVSPYSNCEILEMNLANAKRKQYDLQDSWQSIKDLTIAVG